MPTNPPSSTQPQPQSTLHTLISRAHSPSSTQKILSEKISTKPLLLQPSVSTDRRALRRHIRQRKTQYHTRKQARKGKKPLSAKEKRRLGVYQLKKDEVVGKLDVYKGLNALWNGYMLEVLGYTRNGEVVKGWERREVSTRNAGSGGGGQGSLLTSADFHGAEMEVVRSQDVGRVGCKGVVVRETKFAFVIVGEKQGKGRWWTVPKRGSVFLVGVRLPEIEGEEGRTVKFEIQGGLFEYRPIERANRKFKLRAFEDV